MEYIKIFIFPIIIIFLSFIYHYGFKCNNYWKKNGIPFVSGALPFIGHNWPLICARKSFILLYYNFYKKIGNHSMIGYYNFCVPGLILHDPELIKTVMLTEFKSFDKNTSSLDRNLDPLLTTNPFFTSDIEWQKNRKILINALSSSRLKYIALQLQNVCEKFSNYIEKKLIDSDGNFSVNIRQLTSRFTAEFVAIAGFGIDGKSFTDEPNTFETSIKLMFPPIGSNGLVQTIVLFFPFLAKILQKRLIPKTVDNYFRQIIKSVLKNRRETGDTSPDFLQKVTELCQIEKHEIDENAVTSHAASFLLNGYETSGIAMSYVIYQIAVHSAVQTKLREEVINVFEKYNGEITYESIQEMKYMDQVINESMRLMPALPYLAKICTKKIKLIGNDGLECIVHPGTEIIICTMGLHRDPLFWNNPDNFDPERFNDIKKSDLNKYIYLPFGAGPRICVGMRVGLMQIKASLATLLKKYLIEVDPRTKGPLELHPLSGLFSAPKNEMWLRIKPLK